MYPIPPKTKYGIDMRYKIPLFKPLPTVLSSPSILDSTDWRHMAHCAMAGENEQLNKMDRQTILMVFIVQLLRWVIWCKHQINNYTSGSYIQPER